MFARRAVTSAQIVAGAAAASLLIVCQQVGAKAARDALFLSSFGASALPSMMIAAAVLSLGAVLALSKLLARFGPARVVPWAFAASAGFFALEWLCWSPFPRFASLLLYVHLSMFGAPAISAFWSLVNEHFDPHQAKKVFAKISAGGSLGGLLGGVLAERIAAWFQASSMLGVLSLLNVLCALAVARLAAPQKREPKTIAAAPASGIEVLRRTPYLQRLATLIALTAIASALIDFSVRARISAAIAPGADQLSFFAGFYAVTGLCTFTLQLTATRTLLARLGLGATLGLHPFFVAAFGLLALFLPGLWPMLLLSAAEEVLAGSVFRSSYELLYTPVPAEQKRSAKTLIDVGFDRLGDITGGAAMIALVALWPDDPRAVLVVAVCVASAAVVITFAIQRGYVKTLVDSLKNGAIALDQKHVVDATTRRALFETMALDRGLLLRQIEELRRSERAKTGLSSGDRETLIDGANTLLSADPAAARSALQHPVDRRLLAFVLPWLANPETEREAAAVLRSHAPRALGQLIDALADPELPVAIRARLPELLGEVAGTRRAQDALFEALDAEPLEVALASARALQAGAAQKTFAPASKELVFAVAERALLRFQHQLGGERVLELVFEILVLALEKESLEVAQRALSTESARMRGTALEYLDNVLPASLRRALSVHFSSLV